LLPVFSLEPCQRLAQHDRLGAGDALREPGERGVSVAGLLERGQHEFRYVRLAGRRGPVTPCTAVPFPARESLFRQPVKYGHHGCVSQVALG